MLLPQVLLRYQLVLLSLLLWQVLVLELLHVAGECNRRNEGDLKTLLAQVTGLEPQDQRILFREKEKQSDEYLHIAGVQDSAKLILLEDPASKKRKMEGMKMNPNVSKVCEAIIAVRAEVDKILGKVAAIESALNNGTKVEEKKIIVLTEMLMIQLLKLGIEAEGEAKALRKVEVLCI